MSFTQITSALCQPSVNIIHGHLGSYWPSQVKIGTLITSVLKDVNTNFCFLCLSRVRSPYNSERRASKTRITTC